MSVEAYAKFITADTGAPEPYASRLAEFMIMARGCESIIDPFLFTENGHARAYFRIWSQNNRPALRGLDKSYFDAKACDVLITGTFHAHYSFSADAIPNGWINGAKTMKGIKCIEEIAKWAKSLQG